MGFNDFEEFDDSSLDLDDILESKKKFNKDYDIPDNKTDKKKKLNLFEDEVDPIPLPKDQLQPANAITFAVANNDLQLDEEEYKKIYNVLKLANMKGMGLRFICNYINPAYKAIAQTYGNENITVYKPWKKFCNTKLKSKLVSDDNIRVAAYYTKNFSKLPVSIKGLKGAIFASVFDTDNRYMSDLIIIYDPYLKDKKTRIDYKKSKQTVDYFFLPKNVEIDIPVFNIADDKAYYAVVKLLK